MDSWLRVYGIRIRIWTTITLALFLAIYLGQITADYPLHIPFLLISILFFIFSWLLSDDVYWIICVSSIFLTGKFDFLPEDLTAFEVLAFLGIVKFAFQNIIFRQKNISLGPRIDRIFMAAFIGIILLHAFKDRFGMRAFGSQVWGGRPYVSVLLCTILYFIIQTFELDPKKWRWLPLAVLIPATFDIIIGLVTYFFPPSIPYIYTFYSGISISGIEGADVTERLGALSGFGLPLVLCLLSYTSLKKLWQPRSWIVIVLLLAGLTLCIQGGYRSAVINCAFVLIAASLRDFKLWSWIPMALFAGLLLGLAALNSSGIITLPQQAQRALVFLPGKWNPEMVENAAGSNQFRFDLWERWEKKSFVNRPWLGGGFGFKKDLLFDGNGFRHSLDYETEMDNFILTQNLHNGLFSTVDGIGILGCIFFIAWCGLTLLRIVMIFLTEDADQQNPGLRWVMLYLFMWTCCFWFGSLRLASFLPIQLALTTVFLRLLRQHEEKLLKTKDA